MATKSKLKKGMAKCDSCQHNVKNFVAILKQGHERTTQKHWFVCLDCYEDDRWQTKISRRVATTSARLSNGYNRSASKRNVSPSQEAWEESIAATSNSNSKEELVGEVKYRDTSNFPSPFKVLEGREIAFYKRRKGKPQTLVIMTGEEFQKRMEDTHGISEQDDQGTP